MTREHQTLTYRWLAGILIVLLIALAGAWAKDVQGSVALARDDRVAMRERLARIEQQQAAIMQQLDRIERKVNQ